MDENVIKKIENEYGEVLDTKKVFWTVVKRKAIYIIPYFLLLWILVGIFFFTKNSLFTITLLLFFISLVLCIIWFYKFYSKIRETFWKQLALKYQWVYKLDKDISKEKALLFNIGHSRSTEHGITANYNNQPFYIFEYEYSIGYGKHRTTYPFTIFEIKFTGSFPHLYLNYKNDWYSNTPSMFSSFAKIPVPNEFENKFKLYAPKEYEIETLQIFTPDVFELLLKLEWNHDMEFVDGELLIYKNMRFNNFADLDTELNKIKKLIDALSPLLNKLKLTQIGNIPSSLII